MFETIMKDYGIEFSWADTSHLSNIEEAVRHNSKLVFIETPTNPMLNLTDIRGASEICRRHNLLSIVDNTFMSPYFQNPISLGADIVIHSSTKYLNGHSDVIGGIVITNNEEVNKRLKYIQNAAGAVPSPFDCWLILRATKTLAVRMKQHNENAKRIADHLSKADYIEKVYYPGLPAHPQHKLAKEQMRGFGGILSVDFGNKSRAMNFLKNTHVFTLAESLGGVESLLCHPVTMTHASVPAEKREKYGLTESLVRLSVGIEDVEDLIEDIEQAVKKN